MILFSQGFSPHASASGAKSARDCTQILVDASLMEIFGMQSGNQTGDLTLCTHSTQMLYIDNQ